ncbi:MAG: methyltransferase domain-containing protein [Bryobacterales bacterium]
MAGVQPYGGDISRHALRLAMQAGHGRLAELDVRQLPLADETFDMLLSNDVLQHLGQAGAAEALAEAKRVLRADCWSFAPPRAPRHLVAPPP